MLQSMPAASQDDQFGGEPVMKRQRQGSISGRLRTASDLEEKGYITRAEKGFIKDLIISGDASLQQALERAQEGDKSEINAICKNLHTRKGSIDLLDHMDLDLAFLGHDDDHDGDGVELFGVGVGRSSGSGEFDVRDDEGIGMDGGLRQVRRSSLDSQLGNFRGLDDLLSGAPGKRDSRGRTSSITSNGGIFGGQDEQGSLQFSHGLFDDNGGVGMNGSGGPTGSGGATSGGSGGNNTQVEMSAYENMAKSLSAQKSKPSPYANSSSSAARASPAMSTSSVASAKDSAGRPPTCTLHTHAVASSSSSSSSSSSGNNMSSYSHSHVHTTMSSGGGADPSREPALYNAEGIDATPSAAINHLAWIKRVEGSDGKLFIGAYSPDQRKKRIERFIEKRSRRVWTKKVKYDVRKNFADSRLRVKGRFVKKEDEEIMRELMTI